MLITFLSGQLSEEHKHNKSLVLYMYCVREIAVSAHSSWLLDNAHAVTQLAKVMTKETRIGFYLF